MIKNGLADQLFSRKVDTIDICKFKSTLSKDFIQQHKPLPNGIVPVPYRLAVPNSNSLPSSKLNDKDPSNILEIRNKRQCQDIAGKRITFSKLRQTAPEQPNLPIQKTPLTGPKFFLMWNKIKFENKNLQPMLLQETNKRDRSLPLLCYSSNNLNEI